MKVRYEKKPWNRWFQFVSEWDASERHMQAQKTDHSGRTEQPGGISIKKVPEEQVAQTRAAVEACPVDANGVLRNG